MECAEWKGGTRRVCRWRTTEDGGWVKENVAGQKQWGMEGERHALDDKQNPPRTTHKRTRARPPDPMTRHQHSRTAAAKLLCTTSMAKARRRPTRSAAQPSPDPQPANSAESAENASPDPVQDQPTTAVAEEKCPACKPNDENKPLDSDKESWVRCDACKDWFHWRCVGADDDLSVIDKWCVPLSGRHIATPHSQSYSQVLQPLSREGPFPYHHTQTPRPKVLPQEIRPRLRQHALRSRLVRPSEMARDDAG